jgi:hypothetical protein
MKIPSQTPLSLKRVIPSREDGEGPHKSTRRHADNPQCSSKATHLVARFLAPLGMTARRRYEIFR